MQQVAGRQRFWWRALDAQTPRASAASSLRPGTSGTTSLYMPQRSRHRPVHRSDTMTLSIPRGERRLRSKRRRVRSLSLFFLATGAVFGAVGAAALALPVDRLREIDFPADAREKASRLMVAAGFGIDQVSITGQRHAADADIYDALDLPNVRTFADFDSSAALKRIERIAWIDTAQITRSYPAGLDIVVQERTPAVIWTRGAEEFLVDATGRVLGPNPQPNQWSLPRFSGEGADKEAAGLLTALQSYPSIAREFASAERVSERRWRMIFRNGSTLELGPDRENEGLAEVSGARELAAALTGSAATIDLRTVGRVTMRPVERQRRKTADASAAHTRPER